VLKLQGRHLAGDARHVSLEPGGCCRITTGALLPAGADTVVPQERVQHVDEHGVTLAPDAVRPGQHVRRAGEDLRRGEVAVPAGRRLRPADLGLLASLGCWRVPVRPRLRVGVFTTGNELVEADQPLAPGTIHDSNRHTLMALLRTLGIEPLDLGIVRDDPAELEAVLRSGAVQADALLSSGGVGVGDADHTLQVAASLGDAVGWSLAVRPGRPMVFARLRRPDGAATVPYFGLPGNPVAAAVGFLVLVQSALRAMQGEAWPWPQGVLVPAGQAIRKRPGRTEYLRGVLRPGPDGRLAVFLAGDQGSGVLKSLSRADLLIELPAGQGDIAAGDPVATIRLG
jgi:molybdopterin molybdotransferase